MPRAILTHARWRGTAFIAGDREYQWLDVFLAAMVRGDWQAFERRLIGGLACVIAADADSARPDDGRVEAEATAFRYARNLLTTEETTKWLERHGLDVEAWTEFHIRDLMRHDRADEIDALIETHGDALTVTGEAFIAEGFCSGVFSTLSHTLAGRAAIAAERRDTTPAASPPDPSDLDHVLIAHAPWLEGLDRAELHVRLAHVAQLEASFQAEAQAALTDPVLEAALVRHRMDWMRIDIERLSFDTEQAAREALLCLREDGLSCHDVAHDSHQSVRDTRDVLERLEPEWRDVVLSAHADEVLGPIAVGHRFEIAVLVAKSQASLDDPLVRARAGEAVVEHMISKAVLAQVRPLSTGEAP